MIRRVGNYALVVPALVVFLLLLVVPLGFLVRVSLWPSAPGAPLTGPLSLSSYVELGDRYFLAILLRTVRIAGLTTLICLALGYPVALVISRSKGFWRTLQMILVISPLFVSVVVRAYGWVLLLGYGGLINTFLIQLGLADQPLRMLHTEGAVLVALVEALLPFMVLSLAAVLDRLDPDLEEAARGLGASPLGAFFRVTFPLSLPGAMAGSLLVFMVTMGSYATPALVGGSRIRLMVTEIYTQVTSVFNWPLAAALSVTLLLVSVGIILLTSRLVGLNRISGAA